ncbi:LPD7 domain-containing protein [Vibrio mediterranei]|uniref:LPD7 domain-containing protein n=1 Tax=Vibrio mediterranei TaxID=689 RepID=UPI00148D669B|nr:LPD7 domain-containing protein [Vibrio mediterranei]NOI26472.1 helix-turn-helix domain-containing protein [Vibrio mediterranei]
MLIRVRGGKNGIAEYLRDGMKSDREQHRDELDKRISIDGDLSLTDSIIKDMAKTDKPENYLHITLSFAERDISENKLREVYEEYKNTFMSAYQLEEYNTYAEIHQPKIKSYVDKSTGETVERFPHIHMVIPRKNLLDAKDLNPRGRYKNNEHFIQAIQEKINYEHDLVSPLDNQRVFKIDQTKLLARYKGDHFKGAKSELKAELFDVIQEKNISSMEAFKDALSNYGEVSVGKLGKPDEYLKIKPYGASRNVRLTDSCFQPDFIERRLLKREKPTEKQVNRLVNEWVSERSHEVKYIHAGSPKLRQQYQALPKEQRGAFLDEQREQYYGRYDLGTGARLSERSTKHRTRTVGDFPTSRRTSDREFGVERVTNRRTSNRSNRVPGMPKLDVASTRRQRRDGSSKLLHDHAPHHLAAKQAGRSAQLRRTGYESRRRVKVRVPSHRKERGLPTSFNSISHGLPASSELKVTHRANVKRYSMLSKRMVSRKRGYRKPLFVRDTLLTVKQLKSRAQQSESYVTQLLDTHHEVQRYQDELTRFRDIRKHLKAAPLLDHLSSSHGLVKTHYSSFKAKDGSVRIKTGRRAYNVSDFCTQYMGLSWDETKVILKRVYGQQRQQQIHQQRLKQEQQAINSIVFVSNKVTQGWRSTNHLDESVRLLKHLQRNEYFNRGRPMALTSLERFRSPESQENIIHSANEEFSLTETAKRIKKARETAAQITLTMNDLVANKNEEKQLVEFLDKTSGDKVFRDIGEKIVMNSRKPSLNHTAVALTLAAEKFGVVKITGTKEFKQQVIDVAVSKDLNIVFADKAMEAEFIRRKEELKQAASVEMSKASSNREVQPTVDTEDNALVKSKRESLSPVSSATSTEDVVSESPQIQAVTLVAHGKAPYLHDKDNSSSYFVELSNGETKWGVGLKGAIEKSGAQIGDEVAVSKLGQEEVSVQVQETDEAGNKLPPEWIDTKRNEWVVEVSRPLSKALEDTITELPAISEDIKALRSGIGWSQKELAEQLGVSSSSVSKWERGKAEPTEEILDKLNSLKADTVRQEFKVEYQWDKSAGKLSVMVNGSKPEHVEKKILEQIVEKDPFLKHYSVDEVRSGKLDRSKAQTVQPVPKAYDANANVIDTMTEKRSAKLK